jgi:hypothetical protein
MNSVLLETATGCEEEPGWWRQALRGIVRPAPRPGPISSERVDRGAQRLAARLGALLDDNWTLICGPCNSGGRLEHVLVGPRGVLALACSGLNGRMHCDGQHWRRDKFDLYNNLVESAAPLRTDPTGGLYRAAARLQQVLAAHTSIGQVGTALVFTHPAATLGTIRHAVLNMVTLLSDLKSATLLQAMSGQPDHRTIDGVVQVIRHEHVRVIGRAGEQPGKRQASLFTR